MSKNEITYKELYELVDQRTQSIQHSFDEFKLKEFSPLKEKVDRMWVYVSAAAALVVIAVEVAIKNIANAFTK